MRVKVHPHKPMVDNGSEACISVTPDKKHGRAYYMGTVALSGVQFRIHESGLRKARNEQVRNVHAWAVGEVIHEAIEQIPPTPKMLSQMVPVHYDYHSGLFMTLESRRGGMVCWGLDLTDKSFNAAYVCGPNVYVSKEGIR